MKPGLSQYLHVSQVYYAVKYRESAFLCSSIGVAGTTKLFIREIKDDDGIPIFFARVGVAILGVTNRRDSALSEANPFDADFNDNFVEGSGATQEAAVQALKKDLKSLSDTLFI